MSNKKVSQLDSALSIALLDLLLLTQVDSNAETGYTSKKITVSDLAEKLLADIQYATDLPDFTDKTITGALEELRAFLMSQLPTKTATGSIANFTTSLALPLVSAKFAIKATGGNGTSSPIPLNGFTGLNVTKTGKNLVVGTIAGGSIGSNGSIAGGSTQYDMVIGLIVKGVTYAITTNESTNQFVGGYFTTLPQVGSTSYDGQRVVQYQKTFTAPITGYVVFRVMTGYEYPQLEIGTTATDYIAPVTPTVYPITFPAGAGTVYGGEIDVLNGKLKPCKYYASYNDETIVGPYLSSTSDLSAGAEVVDFGSFDEEVDIDTTSITALVGVNNIWGDTNGNASVEYKQSIPDAIAEVQALVL